MCIYHLIYTQKYIHMTLFIFRDMYVHIHSYSEWIKQSFVESTKSVNCKCSNVEHDGCEALNRLLL